MPKKGPGGGTDGDLAAAGEAAIERGVLLFKLLGNLHAPSDYLPNVRLHDLPVFGGFCRADSTTMSAPCHCRSSTVHSRRSTEWLWCRTRQGVSDTCRRGQEGHEEH